LIVIDGAAIARAIGVAGFDVRFDFHFSIFLINTGEKESQNCSLGPKKVFLGPSRSKFASQP
jgi:hypothetical protein